MADTTMVRVGYHAHRIVEDASASFWLSGTEGDDAARRAESLHASIHADLDKLADLLGYELTKKPTGKETTHEDAA